MIRLLFRSPVACFALILAIVIFGTVEFFKLPVALYPQTSQSRIDVWCEFGSSSSREFRTQYGKDLEQALRAVDGVSKVIGEYNTNSSVFKVDFEWGIDADEAKTRVRSVVDPIAARFPRFWNPPFVMFRGQFNSRFFFSLSSSEVSIEELNRLLRDRLKSKLRSVKGLADLWTIEVGAKNVVIEFDPDALIRFDLTPELVLSQLAKKEIDTSLGHLSGGQRPQVLWVQHAEDLEALASTLLVTARAKRVRLDQLAKVSLDENKDQTIFKTNGIRSILVGGYAKPNANIRQVADAFEVLLRDEVRAFAQDKVRVDELLSPSEYIDASIQNVLFSVAIGVLITFVVTFVFLGHWINTLLISLAIPLSGLGGFILMRLMKIEINLISMGAMALAVGMVVDGAIIVLENITRRLGESDLQTTIGDATRQVQDSVVASLLTTIIVFLPLPFTSPLASAVLGDLAIVMISVLIVSLIVTLYILPPLVFHVGAHRIRTSKNRFSTMYQSMEDRYRKALQWVLASRKYRRILYVSSTVLLVLSVVLMIWGVRREVLAEPDTNRVFVRLDASQSPLSREDLEAVLDDMEAKLRRSYGNWIENTLTEVDQRDGFILVSLRSASIAKLFKERVEKDFKNTATLKIHIDPWSPTALELPNPPIYRLRINSEDERQRRTILRSIQEALEKSAQFGRIDAHPSDQPSKMIKIRPMTWLDSQISEAQLVSSLQLMMNSRRLFSMDIAGQSYDVQLRSKEKRLRHQTDLENLPFRLADRTLPLRALAEIRTTEGFTDLFTIDGRDAAFVDVWPKFEDRRRSKTELRKKMKEALRDIPDGQLIAWEDQDGEITENLLSLGQALFLSLVAIAAVLLLQFSTLRSLAVIFAAIPLGLIGTGLALWIFQSSLSMNSVLGMMLLAGTAVNNSIVLVDFYRQVPEGPRLATVVDVAILRLRPILMTTLTTVFGMLPLAMALGDGGSILQPLGIAVSAGLGISTLLTLFVVPSLMVDIEVRDAF